jgi:hypothetical protein
MHGSMVPFVQTAFAGSPRAKWEPSTTDTNPTRVQFSSDAPFFLAANPAAGYIKTKTPVNATYLDGWGTNGRAAGIRIELWIKRSGAESAVDACLVEVYNDVIPGQSRVRFYARRDGGLRAEVTNGADVYLVSSDDHVYRERLASRRRPLRRRQRTDHVPGRRHFRNDHPCLDGGIDTGRRPGPV